MSVLYADPPPEPNRRTARIAGAIYLLLIAAGVTSEFFLRGPLVSAPDPVAAIAAAPMTFRLSLLGDLVMLLCDITLALLFFDLLQKFSVALARAAIIFRLIQAVLIAMLLVLMAQVPALAMGTQSEFARIILDMHVIGYDLALVFFGVNTGLTALLLARSQVAPRVLTSMLFGAAVVYVSGGVLRLFLPQYCAAFAPAYMLPLIAETSLALWLLLYARL